MDFTIVSSTKPRKPLKEHCLLRSHYLLECLSCFRVDTKGPTLGPDWPKCLFPFRPLRPLSWLITPSSVFGASLSCLRVVSLLQFQSTSAPSAIFLTRLPLKFCSLVKSDHSWPSLSLSAPPVPTEPRHLSPIMKSSGLHNWGVGWLMSSQVAHSTSNFSALSSSRPQNVAHKNCLAQNLPQKNCLLKSSLSENIASSTSFHHKNCLAQNLAHQTPNNILDPDVYLNQGLHHQVWWFYYQKDFTTKKQKVLFSKFF